MKHVSANSDITPLIDSAKRFNRKLISFDAYNIPDFFHPVQIGGWDLLRSTALVHMA